MRDLLPSLFTLNVTNFYVALAGERDRRGVLELIRKHLKPHQRVFVGVIAPIDPRLETAEEVCDRVLEAARYIPVDQLGTTDDCGFSPFCDDTSTTRELAFAKIRARVEGTALAEKVISWARPPSARDRRSRGTATASRGAQERRGDPRRAPARRARARRRPRTRSSDARRSCGSNASGSRSRSRASATP